MRASIWIGLIILAVGIFLSYLADAMIEAQVAGVMQTMASTIAAVIFVMFSASMLGFGAAMVVHWIIGFATHWKASVAEMVVSFATFFVGIGATIMSGNVWTGVQVFFTFFTASMTLFLMAFMHLFGGMAAGISKVTKYLKKKFKR